MLYSGGSHEQKAPLSSRAGVFGVHTSDGSLKKWEVNVGSKLGTSGEELGVASSFPIACLCARDGVYGETASQPFLLTSVWVYSH